MTTCFESTLMHNYYTTRGNDDAHTYKTTG